jgi:uncharacterized protein
MPSLPVSGPPSRVLIAPWYHTVLLLLILTALAWWGIHVNKMSAVPPSGEHQAAQQHGQALAYVINIASEWLLLLFIWAGVNNRKGLRGLTGGRWTSWRQVGIDVAIAAPFWVLWTATARFTWYLIGPPKGPHGPLNFPPHGLMDISAWLALSATAGVCEEIMYRGYLQQQFGAITGSASVGLLVQAALFGLGHTYQGWKPVFVISILGLLYGLLVQWRRNLRSAMIAHAWSDMFEGYFKFLWT